MNILEKELGPAKKDWEKARKLEFFGRRLNNISLAIAGALLLYLTLRWFGVEYLQEASREEVRKYALTVFLVAVSLNLLSYIPLKRSESLKDSIGPILTAKIKKDSGVPTAKFKYEEYKALKALKEFEAELEDDHKIEEKTSIDVSERLNRIDELDHAERNLNTLKEKSRKPEHDDKAPILIKEIIYHSDDEPTASANETFKIEDLANKNPESDASVAFERLKALQSRIDNLKKDLQ